MQGERVWSTDVLCFVVPQALYTEVKNADVGSGSAHIYIYIHWHIVSRGSGVCTVYPQQAIEN